MNREKKEENPLFPDAVAVAIGLEEKPRGGRVTLLDTPLGGLLSGFRRRRRTSGGVMTASSDKRDRGLLNRWLVVRRDAAAMPELLTHEV